MGEIEETTVENKISFDEDRNTPLHYASASGNLEGVADYVEKYRKVDLENFLGWTPLMMAARNGHLEVVKVLMDAKANATKSNNFGASVFMMACANGNVEIIDTILRHLLKGGVSRQIIESTLSPISMVILFKHDHIVQDLIAKGFNVNAETAFTGVTPLMYAAVMKNSGIFNILISHGANLFAKNVNEQSAHDITESQLQCKRPNLRSQVPQPAPYVHCRGHFPSPQIFSTVPSSTPYGVRSPVTFISPQPMLIPVASTSATYPQRRSSNLISPVIISPGLSPINRRPQIFFPPDFNINQFLQPMNNYNYGVDIANPNNNLFNTTYIIPRYQ